jgi:hypothetical protein
MNTNETNNHLRRIQNMMAILAVLFVLALSGNSAHAATITVTGTGDTVAVDGVVTLREAICAVNTNKVCGDAPAGSFGFDTIKFNIPGPGVHTISPLSPLDPFLEPVTIDGYSQPGASENTLGDADNAVLLIELNGSNSISSGIILLVPAYGSTVRGLVVNRFQYGIDMVGGSSANLVEGCFIGTDPTGLVARPNTLFGVKVDQSSTNRIGGTTPAQRNLISGNGTCVNGICTGGILIFGDSTVEQNLVQGNLIGTDRTGTVALGNVGDGVILSGSAQGNTIGGTVPGARNVISGNRYGISLNNAQTNKIIGNFIGTDTTGNVALPNSEGIFVKGPSTGNIIGGTTAAERNIISGNDGPSSGGIRFSGDGVSSNTIQGNYIGLNASGTSALSNFSGIIFDGGSVNSNLIGGSVAGAGNVISGNKGVGINIAATASGNSIKGNLIGTNPAGTTAIGNGVGVELASSGITILGGVTDGVRNIISGNSGDGVILAFSGVGALGVTVEGNYIGTDITGLNALGNTGHGIFLDQANNCLIGGASTGARNRIAYNGGAGVLASGTKADRVIGNEIYANGGLGIDLSPTGVTQNDLNDVDLGTNNLQNFPVINSAVSTPTQTTITGSLNSVANTQFRVELFASQSCDGSGFGEGRSFIGFTTVTTSGNDASFSVTLQGFHAGQFVSATATEASGNTSEFSACKQVAGSGVPSISISSASQSEGNQGNTNLDLNVTLSQPAVTPVTVDYATAPGTATNGNDFQPTSGTLNFGPGETVKTITVLINGDIQDESNETLLVNLTNPGNATIQTGQGIGTILDDDAGPPTIQLSQSTYQVQEALTASVITVTRSGDTSGIASIGYTTVDGSAKQKGDYEFAAGTLNFAAGEASKTFALLVNDDSYVEGDETLVVSLSTPKGATLGQPGSATVTIKDDQIEAVSNPNDDAENFVYQHYHDFLNREPDAAGLAFWTSEINSCGANAQCIETKRINVSAAFFLSVEFQQTGYLAYRMYKAAYGNLPGSPVPPVSFTQFLRDTQRLGQGVQVGIGNWQTKLDTNKAAFASDFVARTDFITTFPQTMTATQFVDTLNQNADGVLSQTKRDQLINDLMTNSKTRAQVLRAVAEDSRLVQDEFNKAFVLTQYFGYLRRNPNSNPDTNFDGYQFWLNKLNQFNGNFVDADMVKAFINSSEYQDRFSAVHSH